MIHHDTNPGPPWHVVHVIGSLRIGGAEKMLANLMQAMDRQEFRHTVLCLETAGDLATQVEKSGIRVKVFPVRMRNLPRDVHRLADWMRSEQVAVVHAHMYSATFWSHLAGMRAGVPVLIKTEHGKELWKNGLQIAVGRWLSSRSFRHIAVSQDVAEIRQNQHGIPGERIVVVPNGVPILPAALDDQVRQDTRRSLGLAKTQPVMGSVGRVVPAKAYPDLLEALAIARRTVPELHWLQIGDGPDRESLMARTRELGLTGGVTFAGRRDDIPDLLAAMDLWVMSSIREGLPVSLLEAMGAGCPIVATEVGGIPDAVTHGESAWLVPAGDPAAMAEGIIKVLVDNELACRLKAVARSRVVADYGIEAVARKIEDIYRQGLAS